MTLEKYFSQVTVVEHKNGVKEAVARSQLVKFAPWCIALSDRIPPPADR